MVLSPSICHLCGKVGEMGSHLFLHCDFTLQVWNYFKQWLSLQFSMPKLVGDLAH